MLILRARNTGQKPGHLVLLFGLGLIGKAIQRQLQVGGFVDDRTMEFDWLNPQERQRQQQDICRTVVSGRDETHRVSLVWAAGRTGFHSTSEQLEEEHNSFSSVVDLYRSLSAVFGDAHLSFHMLSSAGGLFEGQRLIDSDS